MDAKPDNSHNAGRSPLDKSTDRSVRQTQQNRSEMSVTWPVAQGETPCPYPWPGEGSPAGARSFNVDDYRGS